MSESAGARGIRRAVVIALAAVISIGGSLSVLTPAESASALSGGDFMPGLIIADSQFYNGGAMTETQIQQFLASKGSALAGYSFSVGSRARITNSSNVTRCNAFDGGTLAASTIIYRAQVACGISAKVLLVTLQKEQGLITKSAPSQSALDRAMGYACPDTAPCAPTTLGFGNQVYSAALQFITYKVSGFARQPGWQSIGYSPNASCGATTIYLQNYATAALYNYTPYQPNAAALANLNGTGDGCSSYGNRNFWVYYSNWFGSTLGPDPYPVVDPTVAGASTVGATLTAIPGTWGGAPTLSYVWISCSSALPSFFNTVPSGCSTISDVSTSYVSVTADIGKFIGILVTGANSFGSMTTGAAMAVPVGFPASTSAPTVSGSAAPGSTWTLNVGTWTGSPPPTFVQAWLRCSQPVTAAFTVVPAACTAIPNMHDVSYVSTSADVGMYLTAQVAGINTFGYALAGAIGTIQVGSPEATTGPTVSGSTSVGSTWTLNVGTWTGTPAPTFVQAWLRCDAPVASAFTTVPAGCSAISGAKATSYVTTAADVGKYVTAQVAGVNSLGYTLAGATSTSPVVATLPTAPVNTVPPSVSGAASVGSTWTLNTGTWTGTPAPTFVQAWLRCSAPVASVFTTVPSGCSAISGATSGSYVTTSADAGKYVTVQVAGVNSVGYALSGATSTSPVIATASTGPVNTAPPSVSGVASVGSTWTLNTGTWTGTPSPAFVQAWLRCSAPVSAGFSAVPPGCTAISGARSTSYVVSVSDAGSYLTAQVAGTNPSGSVLVVAVDTTPIAPTTSTRPINTVAPGLSGSVSVGSTMSLDRGTWTGSPVPTFVQAWLRCAAPIPSAFTTVPAGCSAIPGATATSYVVTTADVGSYVTAQIAGSNASGSTLAGAPSTARATLAVPAVPANMVLPTVSGAASVGSTWTLNVGTWSGTPAPTFVQAWLRCTAPVAAAFTTVPAGCSAISGATSDTYLTTSADAGKYVTAQVAGVNSLGYSLAGATSTAAIVGP